MLSRSIPVSSFLLVILLGVVAPASGSPQNSVPAATGGGSGSGIPTVDGAKNAACKPWYAIRDAIMGGIYHGRCGDPARAAVRLAFHDAGTFSLALEAAGLPNGGADGSMLVDPNEVLRAENNGLQNIVSLLNPLPAQFNVSPGDVLHLAGVLGVLACPGGPVINTYIGRKAPTNIAPDGLLPDTNSPVPVLTDRFADMGISIRELMALIGAHTAGRQRFVNLALAQSTFDSTVDIWDVRFYSETQSSSVIPGTFRLPSDVNFSHNATTQQDYNRFVGNQDNWGREYADAHEKMSLLGVDQTTLTDCTEILPLSIDLKDLAVSSSGQQPTDPAIDPVKLEAAIQKYRSIWL
ncbi:heme peroxidase [Mycena albidolilacea]|uniref:Peroxidase n=1 Tax=Mycena albidolilacea TaxID=1033008 RepID=A0AAD6Z0A8_9AGAR|nr:heme peroxidase [Mycena albidolilacea]